MRATAVDLAAGIAGGIVATRVTGLVEKMLWQATPDGEKAREPETEDGSSAGAAARKLLDCVEEQPPERQLEAAKTALHYGLGAGWGPLYCWLRRHTRLKPAAAGIASGVALSLVVDETLNPLMKITPPASAYPASSHIRGLMTHAAWGLICGAVAEPLRRRLRRRSRTA